ncbi:Peptidoglycan/LPS O-acetylase OafA/YrhL, contains acyltransferase and SGNH-hydrolase domains [Pseudomonas sp. NFIX10]|uniref:acyltransferase family protein n=1 Tax=unclassified Pseudomonas TaxID=196821 RepID=UPI0008F0BD16|nr:MULTISPECIES: acyltransferase [unclassified Pseudomonas]SFB50463.1 Peptidoglycan/LPS O-acetylase OafA/YrhL, contains acyltransferase and SGNH-hydrolase domains [Pseudomonas sp. NFIX10]SFF32154.1 Peptidoglycan/LPS O-acetylase OafA/YrhL, contains acyltransferase and SGNH-hydrolase domains [Pseudomonas sp. NFACC06-1]
MSQKHLPALDGLRGIAALIVVVSHYSNATGLFGGILGWGGGQTGVMLFFVLAGYLMTHLHIGEQFTASNVGSYTIKRIARIYPFFVIVAALPSLLLFLEFPGAVAMGDINSVSVYLRQILLLDKGSGVFWTIQIEVMFYVVFVGIWAMHRVLNRPVVTLLFVLGALAGLGLQGFKFDIQFFSFVHYFLIGVASALLVQVVVVNSYRSIYLSVVAVLLLISLPFTFPKIFVLLTGEVILSWSSIVMLVQITLLFNFVLRDRRFLQGFLSSRLLVWVGKVSYSIYLLHCFILFPLVSWTKPSDNFALNFTIFIVAVLAISGLSHKYLERPIQRITLTLPILVSRTFSRSSAPMDVRPTK